MTITKREPASAVMLAARIARAYPSLSAYSVAILATDLVAIERAQRRHAERCCSGEDGGYVKWSPAPASRGTKAVMPEHDPIAEQRAGERIEKRMREWLERIGELLIYADGHDAKTAPPSKRIALANVQDIELQGDPRGAVLLLRLPGETDAVSV